MEDPFAKSKVRRVTLKNLPEFKQYLRARGAEKLYEIAKQVTHEAGFPYTDPRTLETTQPPKPRKKRKMSNSKKMPTWVLLDQIHIDVNVRSDISEQERRRIVQEINSPSMNRLFTYMIEGADRGKVRVEITK
jgi:hypothetical protein